MKSHPKTGAEKSSPAAARKPDATLIIVAALMMLFGIAEIVTGFRHTFFGIRTTQNALATNLCVGIGVLYFLAGAILSPKKFALALAFCFLIVVIMGRVVMVVTGLYPVDSREQLMAIVAGTSIACVFAIVIAIRLRSKPIR